MTQETYRRELERNRIQRLRRELKLKEEEQQLEKVYPLGYNISSKLNL